MSDDQTSSKGEDYSIQELSRLARAGVLRVPEFQRSFRWDADDVLALFDSILRGYPVGSVLLWRKGAPKGRIVIGPMVVDAPAIDEALWVVDGQQRITTLVNAVNPDSYEKDARFRLVFDVDANLFIRERDVRGQLTIPLPDLFDVARLLGWLQLNPNAQP